jgi:hypothetical protein
LNFNNRVEEFSEVYIEASSRAALCMDGSEVGESVLWRMWHASELGPIFAHNGRVEEGRTRSAVEQVIHNRMKFSQLSQMAQT